MAGFDVVKFLIFIAVLILSIALHEAAHAFTANTLGDSTPARDGRLTLNPLVHLDPLGTIFILVSSVTGFGIGWGKPVLVNTAQLKYGPLRGMALVAFAGPLMNLVLAVVFGISFRFLGPFLAPYPYLGLFYTAVIGLNIVLALFNLIPVFPLDGFNILVGILPPRQSLGLRSTARYGPIILLGLLFFSSYLPTQLNIFYYIAAARDFLVTIITGA